MPQGHRHGGVPAGASRSTALRLPEHSDPTPLFTARFSYQRRRVKRVIPLVVWLGLGAGLAVLTTRVADWLVMTDELLYERLALSVTGLRSPLPHVHHELVATFDQVYPLLIAPFLAHGAIGQGLYAVHIANAFMMTAAVLPVYVLTVRMTRAVWAGVIAAVLTGVVPWMTLASLLLTNVVAYPLFACALLAIHVAVTTPSKRNDTLAAVAIVLAIGARTQLAVLALVLAVAVLVHSRPRRHPVLIALYGAGVALAAGVAATGHSPLGAYGTTAHGNPLPLDVFPALLSHLAAIALGLGLIPFLVGGGWLIARAGRDPFATIGAAAVVALVVEVASYDVRFGGGLPRDRYLCYLAPVFAVAFAAGLAERVSPVWLLAPTALLAAGFALAPLPVFTTLNADMPVAVVNNYLREALGGLGGARAFLFAVTLVAAAAVAEAGLLLRRSIFVTLLAVAAIAATTAETGYAFDRLLGTYDAGGRSLTADQSATLGWIDQAVGRDSQVTAVPYPTVQGEYWPNAAYWWDLEFWNASVDRSAGIPGRFEWTPSTFPKLALRFDRVGRASISPPGYVVQAIGDTRFHLTGTVIISNRDAFLVRPSKPWRADWSTTGLSDDGWTRPGTIAQIHVYPYPGQAQPVTRSLQVSVYAPAGVSSRAYSLASNTGKVHGKAGHELVTSDVSVCVPPDHAGSVRLATRPASSIYGSPRDEHTATQPRLAGIFISRIYLSGQTGARC